MTAARILASLRRLIGDPSGTMAIETALVAPTLILLSLGGFEASSMVARQSELQSAAGEAVNIVMAATPSSPTEFDQIETVVEESSGIPEEDVTLEVKYRCGTEANMILDPDACADENTLSTFIVLTMTDRYVPMWTIFGIGSTVDFSVERSVQLS